MVKSAGLTREIIEKFISDSEKFIKWVSINPKLDRNTYDYQKGIYNIKNKFLALSDEEIKGLKLRKVYCKFNGSEFSYVYFHEIDDSEVAEDYRHNFLNTPCQEDDACADYRFLGLSHRADGPSSLWNYSKREFHYLYGVYVTEEEFKEYQIWRKLQKIKEL